MTPEQLAAKVRALRVDPECDPQHALWYCKIGETAREMLPPGSDGPMRDAIEAAYKQLTGHESDYIFSGWAATLTEPELAVVENRFPVYEKTDGATLTEAADLIESQARRIEYLEGLAINTSAEHIWRRKNRELEGAAINDAALCLRESPLGGRCSKPLGHDTHDCGPLSAAEKP